MSSQGWTPGSLLGAKDAAHANLLTAASASHIKVTLKDDTLGLGARLGRQGEQTGLDAFKGLLGRLNGKSDEELKKDERKLEDVRLARYASLKFPEVRFVRAGLLEHEKEPVSTLVPKEETTKKSKSNEKKRSQPGDDETSSSESDTPARKSKKTKSKSKSKSKKSRSREETDSESSSESKKKKSKKRKAESEDADKAAEVKKPAVSRERQPMGRQVLRARHIAQKKRAMLDDKSLNEVGYIQSSFCGSFY
jgi:Pin2-interacting protein X1